MASSDSMSSIRSVLECSICMEEFNEDNLPRILPVPCLHVYCTKCLAKLPRNPRGMITCPSCRKEHKVKVDELNVCRTTMALLDMKHTKHIKREAELEKQGPDPSDSACTVMGQAESASQISGTDIQGLLTTLEASMYKLSQSREILERKINETDAIRKEQLETQKTLKETVNDWMDQVKKTAQERGEQINERLGGVFQTNLSKLKDTKEVLKGRQEALERFRSNMEEQAAALQGDAPADHEKIKKLIEEIKESDYNSHDKISIPLKEVSLDTDVKCQSILADVSSWGDIKTEDITQEIPPFRPQTQLNLAAREKHYHDKTKAKRITTSTKATYVTQLPNGDVTIASSQGLEISVYDSDFKPWGVTPISQSISGIYGMCATPDGKLCISNLDKHTVHVVTPEGRLESSFETCLPPLEKDFYPGGLASNKEGEVFVCDLNNHVVRVFDQSGQECRRLGEGEKPGKRWAPTDVAVSPDGKVAVADIENHKIQVFDGTTGECLSTFGSEGSGPNQLKWPAGIAIDSMGFVAVVEIGNQRIQLFTPSWESFHIIKKQGDPSSSPRGIIFTKRNEIVVCDDTNDWLFIF